MEAHDVKNKSVRNLGILWLAITPIALVMAGLSLMIDSAGKSSWFNATQTFWLLAPLIYVVCGSAAINLFDSRRHYKVGVVFAVSPFYVLTLHIATIIIYW